MLLGGTRIGDERYKRWQTAGIGPTGCESGSRAWRKNISGYECTANKLGNAFFQDRPYILQQAVSRPAGIRLKEVVT